MASILHRFRWIPGAKLRGNIEPRSSKAASNKRWKSEAQQNGRKNAIRNPNASQGVGARPTEWGYGREVNPSPRAGENV